MSNHGKATKTLGGTMMMAGSKKLRLTFLVFIAFYIGNVGAPLIGPFTYTQRLWLISSLTIGLLSVLVLINEKLPSRRTIAIGILLGTLVGLSRPFTGVITFLAFLASMRVMEKTDNKVSIMKRPYALSILLGVGVGVLLGAVNLCLVGVELKFAPSFYACILSLNPGISEEIIYRLFVYAFSLRLLGGRVKTRKEVLWVHVLIIVPHVLLHFPDTYFVDGLLHLDLGTLVIGPVILALLFGLPMTLAMVRRDLTSAMIIHTVVDLIRFTFVGLPL